MPAQPGDVIAGYRVLSLLGSGGMGDVYVVEHPQLERKEAMKVISVAGASNPDFQQRFANEARTAASLDHPSIITVHSYGVDDRTTSEKATGLPWFTMTYLDGPDIASTRLTPAETIGVISQVGDGLDYAHARAIVHRDIKPANIVITRNADGTLARAVILDFGIAQLSNSPQLTAMNSVVGTMAYTAPEIISGHPAAARSDQYSLACTTYHVLTGHAPFEADTATALMMAHVQQPPPPLGQARPDLAALTPVLNRAMAKDPNARYTNCREFAAELHRAFTHAGAGTTAAIAPTPAPTPPPVPRMTANPGFGAGTMGPGSIGPVGPVGMGPNGPGGPNGPWIPNQPPPGKSKRNLLIALAIAAVAVIAIVGTSPLWWPSNDEPAEASANQSVATAYGTVCSVHEEQLYCWGNNASGQLGDGSTGDRRTAAKVGSLSDVTAVAVGGYLTESNTYVVTTCAAANGSAYCWGNNHYGQVGDGSDEQRTTPVKVPGLENVVAVTTSMGASCAVAGDDAELYCWGNGEFGQLGTGNTAKSVKAPTKVPNLKNVTDVSAAGGTVCAVADAELRCWGDNRDGQVGDGSTERRMTPVKIGVLEDVDSVSLGSSASKRDDGGWTYYFYSCAAADGKAYCWGKHAAKPGTVEAPQEITGVDNVEQVTMDVGTACALTDDGAVKCWGNNRFGQVGNGSSDDPVRAPADVGSVSDVRYVATGTSVTCVTTDADTYCWGTNTSGQLGNQQAPADKSGTPVKVAF
ncbi:protein kinase domain-containing protein [Gordonia sp. (in: high G+C Gram-positive bacteria)]|uniref:protein kinase domain-containing protein n=1 Tax=Gordonia sp. (in: high G+C Gram-positive bacteria) TaxID=84139 RepID=UPI003F9D4BAC